jgi:hypothetical protein
VIQLVQKRSQRTTRKEFIDDTEYWWTAACSDQLQRKKCEWSEETHKSKSWSVTTIKDGLSFPEFSVCLHSTEQENCTNRSSGYAICILYQSSTGKKGNCIYISSIISW